MRFLTHINTLAVPVAAFCTAVALIVGGGATLSGGGALLVVLAGAAAVAAGLAGLGVCVPVTTRRLEEIVFGPWLGSPERR